MSKKQLTLKIQIEKGYLTEFCKLTNNCKVQQGVGSSLVRIPLRTGDDPLETSTDYGAKDQIKDKEEWAGSELNQRPPPCQGGILTRLDHRPNI